MIMVLPFLPFVIAYVDTSKDEKTNFCGEKKYFEEVI